MSVRSGHLLHTRALTGSGHLGTLAWAAVPELGPRGNPEAFLHPELQTLVGRPIHRIGLQGACWGRSRVGHRGNLLPVAESFLLGLLGNRRLEEGNRRPGVGILLRGDTLRAEGGSIHPGVDRLLVGVGIHPGPADTGRRREGNFHPQEGIQGNSSLTLGCV